MQPRVLRLKLTLRGAWPRAWRRLQVADDISLAQLDLILRTIAGAPPAEACEFIVDGVSYGRCGHHERRVVGGTLRSTRVRDVLTPVAMCVDYDLSGGWAHRLDVEEIVGTDIRPVPLVLAGTGVWPGAPRLRPRGDSGRFKDVNRRLAALPVAPPDSRRVRSPRTFSTEQRVIHQLLGARHDDNEEDAVFMRRLAAKRRNPVAILSEREVVYLAELELAGGLKPAAPAVRRGGLQPARSWST